VQHSHVQLVCRVLVLTPAAVGTPAPGFASRATPAAAAAHAHVTAAANGFL
jgi:hypothetical protein